MPLYEYRCRKCGTVFEALVTGSRKPRCEACGSTGLEKLLSTFSTSSGSSSSGDLPCAGGACSAGGCSTGQCPFS